MVKYSKTVVVIVCIYDYTKTIELYTLKGIACEYLKAVLILKRKVMATWDLQGSRGENWPGCWLGICC